MGETPAKAMVEILVVGEGVRLPEPEPVYNISPFTNLLDSIRIFIYYELIFQHAVACECKRAFPAKDRSLFKLCSPWFFRNLDR